MSAPERKNGATLKELQVKVGDIVKCTGWTDGDTFQKGAVYTIMTQHPGGLSGEMCAVASNGWTPIESKHADEFEQLFEVVSRAGLTPEALATLPEVQALIAACAAMADEKAVGYEGENNEAAIRNRGTKP